MISSSRETCNPGAASARHGRLHGVGVHDTGGGVEGVHSGVDSTLGDGPGQHSGGVQVSEGGGRGGVSQVVSGHVDGLNNEANYGENKKMCIQLQFL